MKGLCKKFIGDRHDFTAKGDTGQFFVENMAVVRLYVAIISLISLPVAFRKASAYLSAAIFSKAITDNTCTRIRKKEEDRLCT